MDGVTYGTHSLGPILQWMPGDRVARVCCEGAGVHHSDGTGKAYCQASSTMLCKTARDALIKIRVDMLSDRPHAMTNYQLQDPDLQQHGGAWRELHRRVVAWAREEDWLPSAADKRVISSP